jgi:uncharacterized protein YwgA
MREEVLGGLIKRVYKDFEISTFENRVKLQKFIYILQTRGINLGYSFNFYLYGPYSTDLTRAAFQTPDLSSLNAVRFKDPEIEMQFSKIIEQIDKYKNDIKWLECATSIMFLKEIGLDREQIYKRIKNKKTTFNDSYISGVWSEIGRLGWINE